MKKIIVVLLVAVLSLSCEKNEEEIKIGIIAPLTGDAAMFGRSLRQGIEVAIDLQIDNPTGPKFSFTFEDSKGEPSTAVAAANKLINIDKVQCIIGDMFSTTTLAFAPVTVSNNILLVAPTVSSQEVTKLGPKIFRLYPSEVEEARAIGEYFKSTVSDSNTAILYINEDAMIKVQSELIKVIGKDRIVFSESYTKGKTSYQDLLAKLRPIKASNTFLLGYLNDVAIILRQAKQIGIKSNFWGLSSLYDPKLIELAGSSAENLTVAAPKFNLVSDDSVSTAFVKAYRSKFSVDPNVWSGYGFDALRLVVYAYNVSKRNGIEPSQVLIDIKNFQAVTGDLSFTSDRGVNKKINIVQVKNKEFVNIR